MCKSRYNTLKITKTGQQSAGSGKRAAGSLPGTFEYSTPPETVQYSQETILIYSDIALTIRLRLPTSLVNE